MKKLYLTYFSCEEVVVDKLLEFTLNPKNKFLNNPQKPFWFKNLVLIVLSKNQSVLFILITGKLKL